MRVFVRGSILDTVLSLTLTAQTDPAPAATEEGELPTGIECAIRPVEESSTPTASPDTPANACELPEPPPSANTGIATAAAITPTRAAETVERRRRTGGDLIGSAPRNGG